MENADLSLLTCVNATKINNLSMWFESLCGCHQFVTRLDRSSRKYNIIGLDTSERLNGWLRN